MAETIFDEFYDDDQSKNHEFYSLEPNDFDNESSIPDSSAKENMVLLHLEQSFLLNGLDFIIVDRSSTNKSYDSLVLHKKTDYLFKVQAKSSSTIDYGGAKQKGSWNTKPKENVYVFRNFGIEEVENRYKNISIFALYCGRTHKTSTGPEYRYRIYIIDRKELINYINSSASKKMLKIDMTDPFWIEKNGNYSIFNDFYEKFESIKIKKIDTLIVDKDHKVIDNKIIYEYTIGDISSAENACESIGRRFDYDEFIAYLKDKQNG